MNRYYYDLHIHSALSPCSHGDMSPNNIINMSLLKGLDIISVTDHNSAKNVEVTYNIAKKKDILVIPGIEVETFEGIHLLCYFKRVTLLNKFAEIIYSNLPEIKNEEEKWGEQLIFDENDRIVDKETKLLLSSVKLNINEVIDKVHLFQGIVIAAHINRYANGINTILGFIPEDLKISGIEITQNEDDEKYQMYQKVINSDAHNLGEICEKTNSLILRDKTIDDFFTFFSGEA